MEEIFMRKKISIVLSVYVDIQIQGTVGEDVFRCLKHPQHILSLPYAEYRQNHAQNYAGDEYGADGAFQMDVLPAAKKSGNDDGTASTADGLICVRAQVRIDGDRNSSTYGQVKEIRMEVRDDKEQESGKEDYKGSRPVNVEAGNVGSIKVRPVELGEDDGEEDRKDVGKDVGDVGKKPDSNPGLEHLTGKVAQYYGLEESHIKVQWKDD